MKENFRILAPLYGAAFVILFCGISSVNSTVENPTLTFLSVSLVALGVFSSLWMRTQKADQRVVVWIASILAVILFITEPSIHDLRRSYLSSGPESMSNSSVGIVFEWATILFSFTLLTNHSLLFAIVPSMALIGLMSSENLNPEMVTYFLGFILSTVFLMGYHAHLDRTTGAAISEEGKPIPLRPFIVLSSAVVAGAFLIGIVATAPLKIVGHQIFAVASEKVSAPSVSLLPVSLTGDESSMDLKGRPPSLSAREIMRIRSRAGMYWRGGVWDRYTGQSWDSLFNPSNIEPLPYDGFDLTEENLFNITPFSELKKLKGREILIQDVTTRAYNGVLYAAGEPFFVKGPMDHIQADPHLTIRSDYVPNELTYQAKSYISHAMPEDLRKAPSIDEAENDPSLSLLYSNRPSVNYGFDNPPFLEQSQGVNINTQLPYPPDDPTRLSIRKLAERVTGRETNDYDRAISIERFLKSQYYYSLEPPLLPADEDAAEFFLFKSRTGYCEQFANAMAVMLRSLHIPARIAVGYAPGDFDAKTHEWVVKELDAHAWTEVFFPGYGWIPFDPTGGIQAEQPGFFSINKLLSQLIRLLASREFLPTLILLTFAAMFGYILKTEGYDRFLRKPFERWLLRRRSINPNDPRWDVEKNYLRLQKALRKKGAPYHLSQTPLEFQEASLKIFDGREEVAEPVSMLTSLYNEAIYSSRPLAEGSDMASEDLLRQAREGLKRIEKN